MNVRSSIGDRWRIVSLNLDQRRSRRQVARIINISIQTVCNVLRLFQETNDVVERDGRRP
jgi:Trp operon repressor